MRRLTWKDEQGNWGLRDLPWENLCAGVVMDDRTRQRLYGALCKLRDYEDTDLEPAEAAEEREKHRWIPVEERLPDKGERVIICTEHGFRGEAIMKQSGRYFRYGIENEKIFGQKIVAWMPLPEPYWQEKGGDGHTDT